MTLLVGVRVTDGVLMLADCRFSDPPDSPLKRKWDFGQKVFCLTDGLVVGFAGDVDLAASVIPELRREAQDRPRELFDVQRWLPGVLKRKYGQVGKGRDLEVLAAAVVDVTSQAFPMPSVLIGLRSSDDFKPVEYGLWKVAAYGSGAPLADALTLDRVKREINTFGGNPIEGCQQAHELQWAFGGNKDEKASLLVGGYMTAVKVGALWSCGPDSWMAGASGFTHVADFGTDRVERYELRYDGAQDRWEQVATVEGKETKSMPLYPPGEAMPSRESQTFDELDDALSELRTRSARSETGVAWLRESITAPEQAQTLRRTALAGPYPSCAIL